MKLDVLVFAAHPDDAELSCSGAIAAFVARGKKVGIIDLTRGELGTRGTPTIREKEANVASEILGISARENLGFDDGFFVNDRTHQLRVIDTIRKYRPEIVLANALQDRHIDHGRASQLVNDAFFLSGLKKIITYSIDGHLEEAWRPKALYHYIQDRYIQPDVIMDISDFWDTKMKAIQAFQSQFYTPNNPYQGEPHTPISSKTFVDFLEARAREFGRMIGVEFGEGFNKSVPVGVKDLFDLI
ncbi:MAG: bacillithiol biosynthesis deacetylase BshB1 [Bacteroidota bacterium]